MDEYAARKTSIDALQYYGKTHLLQRKMKREGKIRSCALLFITVILVGFLYGALQYKNYSDFEKNTITNSSLKTFEVKSGESLETIAERMIAEGILPAKQVLSIPAYKVFFKLNNIDSGNIQAGVYEIPANASTNQIFNSLKSKSCKEIKVTLKEGLRVEEFSEELERKLAVTGSNFKKEEFISIARNFTTPTDLKLNFVAPKNLEGYLFPDTYNVCNTVDASKMIQLMLLNFDKKVAVQFKQELSQSTLSFDETINLASLVEREARTYETKRNITDVFLKRLNINMPLGSDVTTMYGYGYSTVQNKWWRDGIELDKVINLPHPYSTRTNTGLPPTPIANPGAETIKAVLNPQKNDYWYFLVGNDNQMYYGKTLAEHNFNVCKRLTMTC